MFLEVLFDLTLILKIILIFSQVATVLHAMGKASDPFYPMKGETGQSAVSLSGIDNKML